MARFPKPTTHTFLGHIHRRDVGLTFEVYYGLDERYTIVRRESPREVVATLTSVTEIVPAIDDYLHALDDDDGEQRSPITDFARGGFPMPDQQTFLVGPFNRDEEYPFDLEIAIPISTSEGPRGAVALYAVENLLPGVLTLVGVVPQGAAFPCAVSTYSVVVGTPPCPHNLPPS